MQNSAPVLQRLMAATALAGMATLAWTTWGGPAGGAVFVPMPLSGELRDLAVDCIATGTVRPALSTLSEADLEAIVVIVGRLIGAYSRGEYQEFLALRVGDVASASKLRARDLEGLRALGRELGIPPERMAGDLVSVLGVFWNAYYERPAVARLRPERTSVELNAQGLGARSLETLRESFVALRDRLPGAWIQHELCMPHRRSIEQVARDAGPLRWLDVELHFETHTAGDARLVTRFVWDGVHREWFLQDAASVYSAGDRSERHLIL